MGCAPSSRSASASACSCALPCRRRSSSGPRTSVSSSCCSIGTSRRRRQRRVGPRRDAAELARDEPGMGRSADSPGSLGAVPVALVDAIRRGDNEALVYLAEEAVARYSGIETQPGTERYFLYRVLRALDVSNLLIAVMASQRSEHPDSSEFELRQLRDEVRHRIDLLRQLLAAAVRSRLAIELRLARQRRAVDPAGGGHRCARRVDDGAQRRACRCAAAGPQAGQSRRTAASSPSTRQPRCAAHDSPVAGRRGYPPRSRHGAGRGGPSHSS